MKNSKSKQAFTLVEILVVIGMLTILFAIVLIAINPARQFSQANNTKRRSDVAAILNAVHQYAADNKGVLPTGITTSPLNIGNAVGEANICAALVPTYIAEMPVDPTGTYTSCTTYDTNYSISKSATNNRVTVSAPSAELSETISVTR